MQRRTLGWPTRRLGLLVAHEPVARRRPRRRSEQVGASQTEEGPGRAQHLLGVQGAVDQAVRRAELADPSRRDTAQDQLRRAQHGHHCVQLRRSLCRCRTGTNGHRAPGRPLRLHRLRGRRPGEAPRVARSSVFNCPALGFAQLQPGASVSGSGTWAENKPGSTAHVAAGHYTVVVGGHSASPFA